MSSAPQKENAAPLDDPPQYDPNRGEHSKEHHVSFVQCDIVRFQPSQQDLSIRSSEILSDLREASGYFIEQNTCCINKWAEKIFRWHSQCQFSVRNQRGDNVFYVKEVSNVCCRQCLWPANALRLEFKDPSGQDIFVAERGFNCSCCFALVQPDTIQISTADGELMGKIRELPHILYPRYKITNSLGKKILRIEGPFRPKVCAFCRKEFPFSVKDLGHSEVGVIRKGGANSLENDIVADYSISFAANLEPSSKCLLLAALFMLHYEFFQEGLPKPEEELVMSGLKAILPC